jgi:hypothetical protein
VSGNTVVSSIEEILMRIFLPYLSVVFLVSGLPAQMDPLRWMTVRGQLLLKREIVPAGLLNQNKRLPEALEHLRHAVADLPDARLLLARQLILQGAIPEATTELRAYLPYAPPPKREFVESRLQRLTPRAP